jgi:glycosyltransferase involved in cell wall biosynthesis
MCRTEEIAVIIPCLNEARAIRLLVQEVRAYVSQVIVIDDGSSDNTASEAESAGAMVIRHNSPQGKGASLRHGFESASRHGFRWALAMDGDGQHAADDIPKFLRAIEASPAEMFIGNRLGNARAMPRVRKFVNHWMSQRISAYCGAEIPDSQCGFRMVNLHAWNRLAFSADHFEIESEMIVRFLHVGHTLGFVPVQTRYASECSKIRPLRDAMRWFRWWFAIRHELSPNASVIAVEPEYESTPQDATA